MVVRILEAVDAYYGKRFCGVCRVARLGTVLTNAVAARIGRCVIPQSHTVLSAFVMWFISDRCVIANERESVIRRTDVKSIKLSAMPH